MKEKKWPITVIKVLLGVLMISGGIQHFRSPDLYIPFVPSFLPLTVAIIYVTGLLEIIFGLALFSREWSSTGASGVLWLMLLFLPLHVWDVFSESPAIGSHVAAMIRLPIQFLFIFLAWKVKHHVSQKKLDDPL
tara:strand:- start:8 stop:409 length:402 start_codon:yes stop_codon:yes gene_type:complete